MESFDVVCESCEQMMSISKGALSRLSGRAGRVVCRKCDAKIEFILRGGELRILSGGFLVELIKVDEDELESEEIIVSIPELVLAPSIDEELRIHRDSLPPLTVEEEKFRKSLRDATYDSLFFRPPVFVAMEKESELSRRNCFCSRAAQRSFDSTTQAFAPSTAFTSISLCPPASPSGYRYLPSVERVADPRERCPESSL